MPVDNAPRSRAGGRGAISQAQDDPARASPAAAVQQQAAPSRPQEDEGAGWLPGPHGAKDAIETGAPAATTIEAMRTAARRE